MPLEQLALAMDEAERRSLGAEGTREQPFQRPLAATEGREQGSAMLRGSHREAPW